MVMTCFISLLICVGELLVVASHERANSANQIAELLNMETESASVAVWNLDDGLANHVLSGLRGLGEVESATITDDTDTVRASFNNPVAANKIAFALGRVLLGDAANGSRALSYTDSLGRVSTIGAFKITLNPQTVGENFIAYALTTLFGNLLRSMLVGFVLAWSINRFLARPIIAISKAIQDVDAERPTVLPVPIPIGHQDDELGLLVEGINSALGLLQHEQERLRHLATSDGLTGLPNRALLIERLERALERAAGTEFQVGILFLDLDRFKHVNDTLGHSHGDFLLQAVARRLVSCVKAQDTVGRLGGDEFMIVLEDVAGKAQVAGVASRIIQAIGRIFDFEGYSVHASTAIGIAMYPDDGTDFETLLRAADTAMYSAKAEGTGRLQFFSQEMTERAQRQVSMEANLRHALEYGQLTLHYQPKVDIDGLTLKGVEALVRWEHKGQQIAPAQFIPLAEETGLILPISAWVLENACATLSRWQSQFRPVPVAINLSSRDFADPDLPKRIAAALERHQVAPELLEIEITETSLMSNVEQCAIALSQLREIGVRIAIDDFGTGYSSLSYLRHLPIDVLKIDRSFIGGLPDESVIASLVISLGKKFGLVTIAEGVETELQRAWLSTEQCDQMQGWLTAPALPRIEFEQRFLRRSSKSVSQGD